MKSKSTIINRLYALGFLVLFVASFLFLFPLFYFLLASEKRHPAAHRLRVAWAKFLFWSIGVRLEIENDFQPQKGKAYIFCANHDSYIDIPVLAVALPLVFSFMAKNELARIPLFGYFFRTLDVAVDRGNIRKAPEAYQRASDKLHKGMSLLFFPEGGIIRGPALLKPFKSGAFKLAVEHNIGVVPVSLIDNRSILPDVEPPVLFPGRCRVKIHPAIGPYPLEEGTERRLRQETFEVIYNELAQYHAN